MPVYLLVLFIFLMCLPSQMFESWAVCFISRLLKFLNRVWHRLVLKTGGSNYSLVVLRFCKVSYHGNGIVHGWKRWTSCESPHFSCYSHCFNQRTNKKPHNGEKVHLTYELRLRSIMVEKEWGQEQLVNWQQKHDAACSHLGRSETGQEVG